MPRLGPNRSHQPRLRPGSDGAARGRRGLPVDPQGRTKDGHRFLDGRTVRSNARRRRQLSEAASSTWRTGAALAPDYLPELPPPRSPQAPLPQSFGHKVSAIPPAGCFGQQDALSGGRSLSTPNDHRPPIGVGMAWLTPPLPPNRTGGFPASGSPVSGCSVRLNIST